MCPYPVERELNVSQAIDSVLAWLEEHNIHSSLYITKSELVAIVNLFDSSGQLLSEGSGKGDWATAGAYFEAFEHMMLEHSFISSHIEVWELKEWLVSNKRHPKCIFGNVLREYSNGLIKFSRYNSLLSANTYLVPEILINPFYTGAFPESEAFKFLKKYTSNSGWASGSTLEETILHGANEVIERHYLSELYIQCIGYSNNTDEFHRIIPPRELWDKYQLSIANIDDFSIVMAKTRFDSYFCVCVMASSTSPMAFRSSGVSYSKYHAIERALSELVQIIENYDSNELNFDLKTAEYLNEYERLAEIAHLDKLHSLPFIDLSSLEPDSMVFEEHYQGLLKSFKQSGHDLLFHIGFSSRQLWITSTYIPGLERFNIIDKGISVVPLGER